MTPSSSTILRAAAACAASLAMAACSTAPNRGLAEELGATAHDGMPVGQALHGLQAQGFACASAIGVDRRIDCARNVANLTQTCVERVSFVALSQEDAVSNFAIGEATCGRAIPDAARNVPRPVDHVASIRTGIDL